MNSRERILAAINHQPVDRVPTDIWATPEVMDKLRARFGSDEDVRQALHIDGIADIRPAYIGPPDEVRAEVRHCIDALAGDHTGYILAPCHNLQSLTPIENIVAMYDEAWIYGK